ncbi:bifunctional DNA-formamidopyrimidine glycosylase/DNA-(apurinic or apyrimidinic site) lyase [Brachybacterium sp. DNPG3]
MPELPEVEVVRRGLEPHVVGRIVEHVDVADARIIRRQHGGTDRLRAAVEGSRITAVVRRGKFLWWRLADADGADTGEALMGHLGMSGQLRVRTTEQADADAPAQAAAPSEGPASDPLRHRRLTLHLDDGTIVDMLDQRIFGGLWTSPLEPSADGRSAGAGSPDALLPADARGIARDLLDPAADLPEIARRIRSRRAPIKSLILDQGVVSGIGNIYADEGLWAARLRFDTPGEALSQRKALQLLRETGAVMERALAVGGTSFDALYVNVDGRSGYFARSLSAYGREGEPCPRCGTVMRREAFMGRSSHFCPRCQRRSRTSSGVAR